jgi:hypothetical protein
MGDAGVSPFAYAANMQDIYYTGGRVGVGTMTPKAALHVVSGDGVEVEGGQLAVEDDSTTSNNGIVPRSFGGSLHLYGRAGDIVFHGGVGPGSERMIVKNAGPVGIGTLTPQEAFHVVGSIVAEAPGQGGGRVVMKGIKQYEWYPDSMTSGPGSLVLYDRTAGAVRMVVASGGNVGINTATASRTLDVVGDASISTDLYVGSQIHSAGSCAVTCSSDARLKQNIIPLTPPLTRLLRLHGVTYEWRDPSKHGNLRGPQTGMIAQEVEQVFPDWVGTDADGYKTLTYRGFEALTVESLRELKAENDHLKAENGNLVGKLASIEERLAALEQQRGGPQHASVLGDSRWFGGAMFGLAAVLAPWWMRRRRRAN